MGPGFWQPGAAIEISSARGLDSASKVEIRRKYHVP